MLSFATDFFQNTLDLGWPIARGDYEVILTEMEAGRVSWANLQAIQGLREQYAQRSPFLALRAIYAEKGPKCNWGHPHHVRHTVVSHSSQDYVSKVWPNKGSVAYRGSHGCDSSTDVDQYAYNMILTLFGMLNMIFLFGVIKICVIVPLAWVS